jgi:hypothetical protein
MGPVMSENRKQRDDRASVYQREIFHRSLSKFDLKFESVCNFLSQVLKI